MNQTISNETLVTLHERLDDLRAELEIKDEKCETDEYTESLDKLYDIEEELANVVSEDQVSQEQLNAYVSVLKGIASKHNVPFFWN